MQGKRINALPEFFSQFGEKPNFGPTQSLASDEELDAITKGLPRLLRIRLAQALSSLEYCLKQNPHISENWKQLIETWRNSKCEMKTTNGIYQLPDGTTITFPILIDKLSFKYSELRNEVFNLARVLTEIECFDPALYKCARVSKILQSERGKKSRRGPKYLNAIDIILNKIASEKGGNCLREGNTSNIVRMVQIRWDGDDCPSDSTIRRAVKIKFFK